MTNATERYNPGGPVHAPAPAFTTQATAVEQARAVAEVAAAVQVAGAVLAVKRRVQLVDAVLPPGAGSGLQCSVVLRACLGGHELLVGAARKHAGGSQPHAQAPLREEHNHPQKSVAAGAHAPGPTHRRWRARWPSH